MKLVQGSEGLRQGWRKSLKPAEPPLSMLRKFAQAVSVSVADLLSEEKTKTKRQALPSGDYLDAGDIRVKVRDP